MPIQYLMSGYLSRGIGEECEMLLKFVASLRLGNNCCIMKREKC